MRIYKNDIIKASAISTDDERGLLLCSITDSGFTSIAGVRPLKTSYQTKITRRWFLKS